MFVHQIFLLVFVCVHLIECVSEVNRIWSGQPGNRVSVPDEGKRFLFFTIQTGSGIHSSSFAMRIGVKVTGA